jgi:hypothetical protein
MNRSLLPYSSAFTPFVDKYDTEVDGRAKTTHVIAQQDRHISL